jgi:hypothetical protein
MRIVPASRYKMRGIRWPLRWGGQKDLVMWQRYSPHIRLAMEFCIYDFLGFMTLITSNGQTQSIPILLEVIMPHFKEISNPNRVHRLKRVVV